MIRSPYYKLAAVLLTVIMCTALLGACANQPKQVEVVNPVDIDTIAPVEVSLQKKLLCAAESAAFSGTDLVGLSMEIPENAAITKIYASIRQFGGAGNESDGGNVEITAGPDLIFSHSFAKDPAATVGSFETTFVQPLYIGPDAAVITVRALNGTVGQTVFSIEMTVVYCPNYTPDMI